MKKSLFAKALSIAVTAILLLAIIPLTVSAESYYTTPTGDINTALKAIEKQKFKSPLTVNEVKGYIKHFHDNTAHYVRVPNGSSSGGYGQDNKYKVRVGGMGCLHYASFVSTVIYDYTDAMRYIKKDGETATAAKAKAFLMKYGHAGDHLRVQGSPHSFIFVSAVDNGFYTLQYYGANQAPFFSYYSYADFATCMNKYSGGTTQYYNSSLTIDNDITTFTVSYDANGGSGSMANTTVTYGTNTKIRKNTFTRDGYSFNVWYAQRQSDNTWFYYNQATFQSGWYKKGSQPAGWVEFRYTDETSIARTAEIGDTVTFFAQWNPYTYTITYDANGGTGSMESVSVTSGTNVYAEMNAFTKDDLSFNGWYAQRASDGKWQYQNSSGTLGWYAKGNQPSGWIEFRYTDRARISEVGGNNNDTITFYAQWRVRTNLPGDANDDGVIDGADATAVLRFVNRTTNKPIINKSNANVNKDFDGEGNDIVDGADATMILRNVNRLTNKPILS